MPAPRKPLVFRLVRRKRESPRLLDRETVQAVAREAEAREFSLVLLSRRVPHRIEEAPDGTLVLTAPAFASARARREIDLYLAENQGLDEPQPPVPARSAAAPALAGVFLLLLFHILSNAALPSLGLYPHNWYRAGSAVAGEMAAGQWYRAVTALTLHGDSAHVMANVLIGGTFIVFVCREAGLGMGWFLVLVSGVLGNVANALAQRPEHTSVGFSTAVFAAAGILAAFRLVHGPGKGVRPKLVPVAAGLGLVAMLGTAGERTDLGAHLFGFLAGLLVGLVAGLAVARFGLPPRGADRAALVLALALPVLAWWAAFTCI